jgi:thioredoxin 1|tara:strand:- start:214 stop:531 length:318 start_codon:yes stop_codon:yes gene_type:complete
MVKMISNLVELQNILETNRFVIIDFTASWCGPCQRIGPVFSELSENNPNVACIKIDVDNEDTKQICSLCEVRSMPTFVLVKYGEVVDKLTGSDPSSLERLFSSAS